jgi:hypothetical protein
MCVRRRMPHWAYELRSHLLVIVINIGNMQ